MHVCLSQLDPIYVNKQNITDLDCSNFWHNKWTMYMANITKTSRANINFLSDMIRLFIFYELFYWRSLSLQHCLDPMHMLKNVCKSLMTHLVGEKNNVAARRDLELFNTKQQLWPIVDKITSTIRTNLAPYVILQEHRKIFIGRIKNIRTTIGFGANLYNAFTGKDKVSGLKSHDFYNILCFHIPIAIRGLTTPSVREAIYKLSRLVRWIFTKT